MKEILTLLEQSSGARFLAADLHVHTQASPDTDKRWQAHGPEEVVRLAIAKELDIIAVTDHNSAAYCDEVRAAAEGTSLHVFPGVEISTSQGHLLAIFEKDKSAESISGFLMNAGIKHTDLGTDTAVTTGNMDDVARRVEKEGGIAIAAHVDGDRGFMRVVKVGADKIRIHSCREIRAFEITDATRRDTYLGAKMPGYPRQVPCVQSSDCREPTGGGFHQLDLIGTRFCYLKMDEVSIQGIKQAFLDPDMRVRFVSDPSLEPEYVIEGLWVNGGFLQGQQFRFSDHVSCLIGGTGVGKSLTVELLRFAFDQQTTVETIRKEITSLLEKQLGDGGKVSVLVRRQGHRYLIEREYSSSWEASPTVYAVDEDCDTQEVTDIDLPIFFPVKAYSQSEIIEFTRDAPVRLSLVDSLIDIADERHAITKLKAELSTNASQILEHRKQWAAAEELLKSRGTLQADIKKLEDVLKDVRVVSHRLWYSEREVITGATGTLDALARQAAESYPALPASLISQALASNTPNPTIFEEIAAIEVEASALLETTSAAVKEGLTNLQTRLAGVQKRWEVAFADAERKYVELLQQLDTKQVGLQALSSRLVGLRAQVQELDAKRADVDNRIRPSLTKFGARRDELLTELQDKRKAIRAKRESKAAELNKALNHRVKVQIAHEAESDAFFDAIRDIKTGSYIHDSGMKQVAEHAHPIPFVKQLLAREFDQLKERTGVDQSEFEKLRAFVLEKGRLADLYELQLIDVEDRVDVGLEVGSGTYKDLGNLAHGQRCTVILSVAMAEGSFPLIADQPEDALHAQFIEDHIVKTLRERRGMRQYLFATRNANVLVSGDAEQVFVMEGDAQHGRIERKGSIDRLTTRDLILLNLEGGREAFIRKSRKYGIESA